MATHHTIFLVAATSGLTNQATQVMEQISVFTKSDGKALHGVGELLRANPASAKLAQLLPSVVLPIEVIYAVQGRASSPASPPAKS